MKKFLVLLGSCLLAFTAQAELTFASKVVEVDAAPGKKTAKVTFDFKNTGDSTVKIVKVNTSCGCLKADADKRFKTYKPGEEGKINAEFSIGGNTGTLEKAVLLTTNDTTEQTRLTVKIKVPELLSIEPKMAAWTLNETGPKTVTFKVLREKPIRITEVTSSRKNVTATLKTITEGRHYEIEMVAADTSEIMLGVVRIDTDCEIREQKKQMAFYRISNEDSSSSGNADD